MSCDQGAKRSSGLKGLLALAVVLVGLWGFGPVGSAQAIYQNEFCRGAWLDKYGQPGDNCSGYFGYTFWVAVEAHEHSACASASTNGQKSGVYRPWKCTPGPWSYVQNWIFADRVAGEIIRNNSTGSTNHATGSMLYCLIPSCEEH